MSSVYDIIHFYNIFNEKIKPNTLPDNLISLAFGYDFNQGIDPNTLPKNLTTLTFGHDFNQKIEHDTLPKNLTTLIFEWKFNQKIEANTLPEKLTTLTFGYKFNQKIEPNTLPENLITLTFGGKFTQKIDSEMLPSNSINIKFNWIYFSKNDPIKHHIEMINNIPSYYRVEIFSKEDIFGTNGPIWPIHVVNYRKYKWSPDKYDIQDKYTYPDHDSVIVLINKETYQPYSSAKSDRK